MKIFKRRIKGMCNKCLTGKKTYKLDSREPMCPYIGCYTGKTCLYYVGLDEDDEGGLKKVSNKANGICGS